MRIWFWEKWKKYRLYATELWNQDDKKNNIIGYIIQIIYLDWKTFSFISEFSKSFPLGNSKLALGVIGHIGRVMVWSNCLHVPLCPFNEPLAPYELASPCSHSFRLLVTMSLFYKSPYGTAMWGRAWEFFFFLKKCLYCSFLISNIFSLTLHTCITFTPVCPIKVYRDVMS